MGTLKHFASALGIILTLVAFVPYFRALLRGRIKPHVFSWFIWGLVTFIVFLAQLAAQGGIGSWPVGLSGLLQLGIAALAFHQRTDTSITRSDWIFLISCLSALPLWFLTKDPLAAVIILTGVDLVAYGPTIRRAYHHPYEESVLMFAHFAARNALVLLALEHYSLTTVLFPASVGSVCLVFVLLLFWRRAVAPAEHVANR